MTPPNEPQAGLPIGPGTDISADPEALAAQDDEAPATSDPSQYDGDGDDLGGTGGQNAGGAG